MKRNAERKRQTTASGRHPGGRPAPAGLKAKAKVLFVAGSMTCADVCRRLDISRQSLYKWAAEGDWWPAREESLKARTERSLEEAADLALEEIRKRHGTVAKLATALSGIGLDAALKAVTRDEDRRTPRGAKEVLAVLPPTEARRLMRDGIGTERLVHGLDQGRLSLSLTAGQHEAEQRFAGRVRELLRSRAITLEVARQLLEEGEPEAPPATGGTA